ncbi:MAG: hypothetical protein J3Q66DRAFT_195020 [Benniella sp.]|nr:MAG: hypothetical protein J3Q66DRAFT_195020 [Benniella sp.]
MISGSIFRRVISSVPLCLATTWAFCPIAYTGFLPSLRRKAFLDASMVLDPGEPRLGPRNVGDGSPWRVGVTQRWVWAQ